MKKAGKALSGLLAAAVLAAAAAVIVLAGALLAISALILYRIRAVRELETQAAEQV